jgi:hypothetical protein
LLKLWSREDVLEIPGLNLARIKKPLIKKPCKRLIFIVGPAGLELIQITKNMGPGWCVTGSISEEVAVDCMKTACHLDPKIG